MKPEIENQLKTILDGQQQKKKPTIAVKTKAKNFADFTKLKEDVIKPAFQEIINHFIKRNLPIYMREEDEQKNRTGGVTPARIGLEIYEQRISGNMTPEFVFLYYNGARRLSLFTSTRSQGASAQDNIPFENITVDWIQEEFVKYAKGLHPR